MRYRIMLVVVIALCALRVQANIATEHVQKSSSTLPQVEQIGEGQLVSDPPSALSIEIEKSWATANVRDEEDGGLDAAEAGKEGYPAQQSCSSSGRRDATSEVEPYEYADVDEESGTEETEYEQAVSPVDGHTSSREPYETRQQVMTTADNNDAAMEMGLKEETRGNKIVTDHDASDGSNDAGETTEITSVEGLDNGDAEVPTEGNEPPSQIVQVENYHNEADEAELTISEDSDSGVKVQPVNHDGGSAVSTVKDMNEIPSADWVELRGPEEKEAATEDLLNGELSLEVVSVQNDGRIPKVSAEHGMQYQPSKDERPRREDEREARLSSNLAADDGTAAELDGNEEGSSEPQGSLDEISDALDRKWEITSAGDREQDGHSENAEIAFSQSLDTCNEVRRVNGDTDGAEAEANDPSNSDDYSYRRKLEIAIQSDSISYWWNS